jgi:FHA domain
VSALAIMSAVSVGRPFLSFRDGEGREQHFFLVPEAATVSVGRESSADLVLDWDGQVSRLHARLERAGEDWEVVDEGFSRNGTFVNGERLSGRRRLNDGDTLHFGRTKVLFRANEDGPKLDVTLSTTQRRVLLALCRPYKGRQGFAGPASDEEIAEELFLSVREVRTHIEVLYARLGIGPLAPEERRARLVERAFSGGLISERDL